MSMIMANFYFYLGCFALTAMFAAICVLDEIKKEQEKNEKIEILSKAIEKLNK